VEKLAREVEMKTEATVHNGRENRAN